MNANRIALWVLAALIGLGVVWYGYWFASNFEKRSREVRTDISPEARKNHFFAAELFLSRSDREASSEHSRDIFSLQPGPDDTLFIGSQSRLFIARNHDALWQWIEQGGHLIFVAEEYDAEEEPPALLDEIGIELVELYEDLDILERCQDSEGVCSNDEDENIKGDGEEAVPQWVTTTFRTEQGGEEYPVQFAADRYLNDAYESAEIIVGDETMPNLIQLSFGNGRITVLSDNALFDNDRIGKENHAYLLSKLIGERGKTWIFYSADMPSLLEQLWQRAPYLLLLTVLIVLLAIWRMLLRSGPNLQNRFDERRNLLEHIDASATFGWRIDRARQMFADNRNSVEQAWRRRHPQLNGLEQPQRCEWIGEKSGIAASAIERTLYSEISSEQDFIRASSVLQQLAAQVRQTRGHHA